MKTLAEVKEVFGVPAEDTTVKFYSIVVDGNPYEVVAEHATSDVSVSVDTGEVYACTTGTINAGIATEIVA